MSYEMTDEDADAAILGIECQAFLNSQVGQYVMSTIEGDANKAMNEFAYANLDDRSSLAALQADVRLYIEFASKIDAAIQRGRAADMTAPHD